jgi:hypothetical protein
MPIRSRVLTNDEIINQLEKISKEIDALKGNLRDTSKVGVLSENDFLLHEYDSLRSEIVQRLSVRFTIITITMTAFAAAFAFSFSSTSIGVFLLLGYPTLSLLFMGSYIANSYGIRKLEKYINDVIEHKVREDNHEPTFSPIGWQPHNAKANIKYLKLGLSELVNNMLFPVSGFIAWLVAYIIIFFTNYTTLNKHGINVTNLALSTSFGVILISFILAFFEGKFFHVD